MPKRADLSKALKRAATSTAAEDLLIQQQSERSLAPLDKIQDRITGDTRALNSKHVLELVDSISALGLITPLTVDRKYRLLAGGHRKAALHILIEENPDRFQELFEEGVPVRVMKLDSENDTVDALQIEVEENTQRRNYTVAEIRDAARKLEASGYKKLKGRPGEGEKSLNRELMNIFRLSRRRITEILNESDTESAQDCALSVNAIGYLKQTEKFHKKLSGLELDPLLTKIERDLKRLEKNLRQFIKE